MNDMQNKSDGDAGHKAQNAKKGNSGGDLKTREAAAKNEGNHREAKPGNAGKREGFIRRGQQNREKTSTEAKPQQDDAPITFKEHVLDLEPGFTMPPRSAVDLNYVDFTRESYDAANRRPFVPKKRNAVPYELSDTPRTQTDSRDAQQNDRRGQQGQGDQAKGRRGNQPQQKAEKDKAPRGAKGAASSRGRDSAAEENAGADKTARQDNAVANASANAAAPKANSDTAKNSPEANNRASKKLGFFAQKKEQQKGGDTRRAPAANRDRTQDKDARQNKEAEAGQEQSNGQRQDQSQRQNPQQNPQQNQHQNPNQNARQDQSRNAGQNQAAQGSGAANPNQGEAAPVKESLIRPYWIKK